MNVYCIFLLCIELRRDDGLSYSAVIISQLEG